MHRDCGDLIIQPTFQPYTTQHDASKALRRRVHTSEREKLQAGFPQAAGVDDLQLLGVPDRRVTCSL